MAKRHVIMKDKEHGGANAEQVYSEKFSDYNYASGLTDWLNHINGDNYVYWTVEVDA